MSDPADRRRLETNKPTRRTRAALLQGPSSLTASFASASYDRRSAARSCVSQASIDAQRIIGERLWPNWSAAREMVDTSAGLLLYRLTGGELRVLLVHPGGPFWRNRDEGAWSVPKGVVESGETPEDAARREFAEELGREVRGALLPLGEIRQRGGKRVIAFGVEGEFDCAGLRSNRFEIEWPPKSGRLESFPEIDRAEWFALAQAREKILPSQAPLLDRLEDILASRR